MTTPNAELAWRVLDHIDAHPELHRQEWWLTRTDCGTVACFAGWACILSGDKPITRYGDVNGEIGDEFSYVQSGDRKIFVRERAAALLGIKVEDERDLFAADNTRDDLHRKVEEVFGPRPERAS